MQPFAEIKKLGGCIKIWEGFQPATAWFSCLNCLCSQVLPLSSGAEHSVSVAGDLIKKCTCCFCFTLFFSLQSFGEDFSA